MSKTIFRLTQAGWVLCHLCNISIIVLERLQITFLILSWWRIENILCCIHSNFLTIQTFLKGQFQVFLKSWEAQEELWKQFWSFLVGSFLSFHNFISLYRPLRSFTRSKLAMVIHSKMKICHKALKLTQFSSTLARKFNFSLWLT